MLLLSEHKGFVSTLKPHKEQSQPTGEEVKPDFCLVFVFGDSEVASYVQTIL